MMSREALTRFAAVAATAGCHSDAAAGGGGGADVMGACMRRAGVTLGRSRDIRGRQTFHPFDPTDGFTPQRTIVDHSALWEYDVRPAIEVW